MLTSLLRFNLRLISSIILFLLLPLDLAFLIGVQAFLSSVPTGLAHHHVEFMDSLQINSLVHWMRSEWVLALPIGFVRHRHILHQAVELGFLVCLGLVSTFFR